ncbi:SDR family oxidoreductase [Ferrovibrio sp.]|uniref:SDR family oxidoreductase n=1 Tax=Ferrovibrio sp. TaxID=1917215 RepID=UPI000CB29F49|nr:SDR family oxidoreductase [Ferrovibrio sp.]PJI41908.1 MAG: short-chain dehydrogenase [Ferrovibrio sp.]
MTNDALFGLDGRVVAVTGGLGQLGRQYGHALLARGARLAIIENRGGDAELRAAYPEANPAQIMLVNADVTRRVTLEAALGAIRQRWEVPSGLVNNAAIDSPPDAPASEVGAFETYPETSWDKVMDVNVKGVFLACQVFGGAMAATGRGSIVNVASIYGKVSPNQSIYDFRRQKGEVFFKPVAYSASKSAIYNLTRYLATYWARQGVRVNTLTLAGVFNNQPEEFLAAYTPHVPMGRMAKAEEYEGAVIFLLSGASSYMTGAELVIDGGWTAW